MVHHPPFYKLSDKKSFSDEEYKKIISVLQGKGARISMSMHLNLPLPINGRESLINRSRKKP